MLRVGPRSWALILFTMSLCVVLLSGEGKRESTGDKKRFLKEVDRLENTSEKRAELESYIARNPEGPHLSFAYGVLLDLLRSQQPQAALRLADRILTGQETEAGLHFYAYLTKFAVYGDLRDQNSAVALARRILAFESDPELLRLASRHDPGKVKEYEARIQSALLNSQKTWLIGIRANLFQLRPGEWESMPDEDKARHLTQQIRSHEALPESDPAVIKRFPSLYYEIALVLARLGDGESALSYLERAKPRSGGEFSLHRIRGEVYASLGKSLLAIEDYAQALALHMDPFDWQRIQELCESLGESPEKWLARSRQIRAGQRWIFPDLNLETPEGKPRNLHTFLGSGGGVVVFFSPG